MSELYVNSVDAGREGHSNEKWEPWKDKDICDGLKYLGMFCFGGRIIVNLLLRRPVFWHSNGTTPCVRAP